MTGVLETKDAATGPVGLESLSTAVVITPSVIDEFPPFFGPGPPAFPQADSKTVATSKKLMHKCVIFIGFLPDIQPLQICLNTVILEPSGIFFKVQPVSGTGPARYL
jgi:hypothetical protein